MRFDDIESSSDIIQDYRRKIKKDLAESDLDEFEEEEQCIEDSLVKIFNIIN